MGNTQVNKISRGNIIEYQGQPCFVLERTIHTPPNLTSFCTMQLRNVKTNKVVHVRTNAGDSFDVMHNQIVKMEFSYESQGAYAFMDLETFDQIELSAEVIGDARKYMVPGKEYNIMMVEGTPMMIDLPQFVEMKVIEAPVAIKGDSSGNVQKTVVTETGLEVRTPAFIKEGDSIKVSTSDNSYQGRV
jgi:elongation factor P